MAPQRDRLQRAIPGDAQVTFDDGCGAPAAESPGGSGRAGGSRLRYATTAVVPPDHQFAYWQSLSLVPRIARAHAPTGVARFYGEALFSESCHGLQFIHRCTDPLVWHFGWREPDHVVLVRLHHGALYAQHDRDAVTAIGPQAGLVLCDRDRPAVFTGPDPVGMTYLRLPRALVREALGADPIHTGDAVRRFPEPDAVLVALERQLDRILDMGARGGSADCMPALELARHTVMTLFAKRNPNRWRLPETYDDALLATARCLLALHSADPELAPAHLAGMLGCSRAHLYRQFARAGETLMGALREVRVQRARRLLAARPVMSVGTIAAQCGYSELSVFDRAFRARFHVTPRAFQRRVEARTGHVPAHDE